MTNIEDTEDRAKKERSPSYPFISLPKAIERAQAFSDAHRRSPARVSSIADTWRYAPSSSGLLQTLSALKAYGLLEDTGKGQERKVQLTDLAQRLLFDSRPGAKEAAIREAALSPRLFAEYADKWLPSRPSDSHCLSELRLDRGFTDAASKVFLKSFDETFSYANLLPDDSLSSPEPKLLSDEDDAEAGGTTSSAESGELFEEPIWSWPHVTVPPTRYGGGPAHEIFQGPPGSGVARTLQTTSPPQRPYGPAARGQPQSPRATLPLPEGIAALEIPQGLSRKSYEALKAWAEMMVSLAERSVVKKWYVELYRPHSTKAEGVHYVPNLEALKSFIADSKEAIPGVIIRVMAPDDAEQHELAELRELGARAF